MTKTPNFELTDFLPYLLNQAADALSLEFREIYKGRYGMLRTEWRVLFHLGSYGEMTAKEICTRARIHKTKVSRAITALEAKRYLVRRESAEDRRQAVLSLTREGRRVFDDLSRAAQEFDAELRAGLSAEEARVLRRCLVRFSGLDAGS
ncbi:MAG: MarR family transcriptional regulator [Silicimonas sp.]|nr:MarR family transcriptional regulator [Silicimonas sp.]